MNRRSLAPSVTLALILGAATAGAVQAGGPTRVTESHTDRFFDDFILEICGIETFTTLTERWTFKEFADGSATLHVNRTFVSEDPRLPIEKGAATTFIAADGTRTVIGMPIHLIGPKGGVRIRDAGRIVLDESGNVLSVNGPHPAYGVDLAPYYCP